MHEPADEKLMQAYARGDMGAFECLYERHRGPLYRYILRHVGDAATANDLYQGTWERVIRFRGRYRPKAPFKAWLYRIAHNHVIDHFRSARPTDPLEGESWAGDGPDPEGQVMADGRRQALQRAVAGLPQEQRDALLLRLEAGLDVDTIAKLTGVNRETAKSRLRYAVAKLKRELGGS